MFIKRVLLSSIALLCAANSAAEKSPQLSSWSDYLSSYKPLGELIDSHLESVDNDLLRQELYRTLMGNIAFGYLHLFVSDLKHPQFRPYLDQSHAALAANPDNSYYITPVEPQGVYKISGYRGSVHIVDFQIANGDFLTRGGKNRGLTLANYEIDDLAIASDGQFEVILSNEKPVGYKGDWWELHEDAESVLVRQVSYDWVNEVDARMAIERLDTPATAGRQPVKAIERDLLQLGDYARTWTAFGIKFVDERYIQKGIVNKVESYFLPGGGKADQLYGGGYFELETGEVLVYEAKVPEDCVYWNVHLTDEVWRTIDWTYHQSSLNGFQARVDEDGVFRAVISMEDPGVANWLDTIDYQRGSVIYRWVGCSEFPEPKVSLVKLEDLYDYLPDSTQRVTAQERDATIRERSKAVQLRRRW